MRTPKRIEDFNPLSANPTKRSNTLKQFAGKLAVTLLKETLLHGYFSRKLHKWYQIAQNITHKVLLR